MSADALQVCGPVHGTEDAQRVAVGSGEGVVIGIHDFIGVGSAAALHFGPAFFPDADPVTGTLATSAPLGVGFAAQGRHRRRASGDKATSKKSGASRCWWRP